jgi:hypothetical protein
VKCGVWSGDSSGIRCRACFEHRWGLRSIVDSGVEYWPTVYNSMRSTVRVALLADLSSIRHADTATVTTSRPSAQFLFEKRATSRG